MCLGILCLNGCVNSDGVCPPFPKASSVVVEELNLCPLEKMPYFLDWMNKLYVLELQLHT